MFDYITTYYYGRCVKKSDWYLKSLGINRLYYIHRGNVSILLDNKPYELREGFIYLLPQNLKFELLLTSETEVDHTFFDFLSLPTVKMDTLIELNPARYPYIESAAHILFQLAQEHQTYPSAERNEYSDLIESYLNNLLFLIDKCFPISVVSDPRINFALDYIHKNFSQPITLENLLEVSNLEENYFIRLFKKTMNVTPYQYIKKYRFNIALTMIKRRHSLSEIALAIGYSDISSFSHAFKKIYGFAPSQVIKDAEGK